MNYDNVYDGFVDNEKKKRGESRKKLLMKGKKSMKEKFRPS
jgi:hypothetical protein